MSAVRQWEPSRAFEDLRLRRSAHARKAVGRGPFRLGYLVSHPIQYQAPMLRHIAQDPEIDLTVFYMSDVGVREFRDPQFQVQVKWDMPLLGGYRHVFLDRLGSAMVTPLWRPLSVGLRDAFQRERLEALWLHGYKHQVQLRAFRVARRLRIPVFVRGDSNGLERDLRHELSAHVLRWLFRKIDGFLYIGKRNRDFYAAHGVEDRRLYSVPYAVDNGFFEYAAREASSSRGELRASLKILGDAPLILFAAKLTRGKRPLDLLFAYRRVVQECRPGAEPYLVYVGDGEERKRLEHSARELQLERVRVIGFVNQSELPRYYDLCDVFVLPSEHDRWGLAVNEVMDAGKPVIVTDQVGCAPDLVREGENGFVVPVGDVRLLASRLLQIIREKDRRQRMGEASRRIVAAFSFEQDLQGIQKALHEVCGSTRR